MPFDSEDEVLEYANRRPIRALSDYLDRKSLTGPSNGIRTRSGIVWINCWLIRDLRTPFGGVKDSGMGREGGFEALKFFTEEKNVCIKI